MHHLGRGERVGVIDFPDVRARNGLGTGSGRDCKPDNRVLFNPALRPASEKRASLAQFLPLSRITLRCSTGHKSGRGFRPMQPSS